MATELSMADVVIIGGREGLSSLLTSVLSFCSISSSFSLRVSQRHNDF